MDTVVMTQASLEAITETEALINILDVTLPTITNTSISTAVLSDINIIN